MSFFCVLRLALRELKREFSKAQERGAAAGATRGERSNAKLGVGSRVQEVELGIGTRLLQQLGWNVGEGLGKQGNGIVRPIVPALLGKNRGLGFEEAKKTAKAEERPVPAAAMIEAVCHVCGETIRGRKKIKEHRELHGGGDAKERGKRARNESKMLECEVCGERVQGKEEIKMHKRKHNAKRKKDALEEKRNQRKRKKNEKEEEEEEEEKEEEENGLETKKVESHSNPPNAVARKRPLLAMKGFTAPRRIAKE